MNGTVATLTKKFKRVFENRWPKTLSGFVDRLRWDDDDELVNQYGKAIRKDLCSKVPELNGFNLDFEDYISLPSYPGIYIAYSEDGSFIYQYAGKSNNIRKRVNNRHPVFNKGYGFICFRIDDDKERDLIETKLIKSIQPRLNMQNRW